MPVIQIRSLAQPPGKTKRVLEKVSLEVAKAIDIEPHHVWTTWQEIKPGFYSEGGDIAQSQSHATHPPLVDVLAFEGRTPQTIEKIILAIGEAITSELNLDPGNVFINYREALADRVFTGGQIVRKKK